MRFFPAFLLVSLLAACQSSVPFETVTDACKSLQYLSLVGSRADAVPAGTFPEGARVIRPDTMVTRDYRPERLNVHVNQKGRIERIDCG